MFPADPIDLHQDDALMLPLSPVGIIETVTQLLKATNSGGNLKVFQVIKIT